MLLALIAQSLYGLIQPAIAHAATDSIVSPDAMQSWQLADDSGNGGAINFVATLGSIGSGSAQFSLPGSNQTQSLRTSAYGSTKLSDIATLSYDTYVSSGAAAAPSLKLDIDTDLTDGDTSAQGSLVYSPYKNGAVTPGKWQQQNARNGLWWFSDPSIADQVCSKSNPCNLDTIITLYPHIGIISGGSIDLTASHVSGAPLLSNVDALVINDNTYNFEAIGAPQLLSPANASTSSESSLLTTWQAIPTASKYIYESYTDANATELRTTETLTDTQKKETDIPDGATIWWRVKTIDSQGNEGSWSALWSVAVAATKAPVGGVGEVVSGGGSGQTHELLMQLARLNEPFAVPESMDTFIAPYLLSPIDTAGDDSLASNARKTASPVADRGVKTTAAMPSEDGWKFFGVLWYWWVVPVVVVIAIAIRTVRLTRNEQTFLYSSDQI